MQRTGHVTGRYTGHLELQGPCKAFTEIGPFLLHLSDDAVLIVALAFRRLHALLDLLPGGCRRRRTDAAVLPWKLPYGARRFFLLSQCFLHLELYTEKWSSSIAQKAFPEWRVYNKA